MFSSFLRHKSRSRFLLVVIIALASVTISAKAVQGGPRIVFGSARDGGNHDIYSMELDGSNQVRLTTHAAYDDQPKWSPDSSKIVFMSDRNGNFEIYTMNADGSAQTRITTDFAGDGFPVWSVVIRV